MAAVAFGWGLNWVFGSEGIRRLGTGVISADVGARYYLFVPHW